MEESLLLQFFSELDLVGLGLSDFGRLVHRGTCLIDSTGLKLIICISHHVRFQSGRLSLLSQEYSTRSVLMSFLPTL